MNDLKFDPEAVLIIKKFVLSATISQAFSNSDGELSFEEAENYETFTKKSVSGVEFNIAQDQRDSLVEKLQIALGSAFTVYFSEQNFGHQPDEITVLETSDKYDTLRFEGCNGINYGIYTEDIITHLRQLDKAHPFTLTGVGFDFVQGNFKSPPSSVEGLARQMFEFCPDIVEQGTGDIETLAEEIKRTNSFYYWWD